MPSDLTHHITNEKLIGEFVGVAIAVIAIAVLTRLPTYDLQKRVSL